MCGRYTSSKPIEVYAELFKAKAGNLFVEPRFNIAPTYDVLACRAMPTGRELALLHWGLIPAWAEDKKIGYRTINARAETVAVKPSYRTAFRHRRCLIAADGFYEWRPGKPKKQPYYIRMKEGKPFAFAGLWEHWEPKGMEPVESCTIIVTTANELISQIHDRMPVIIAPKDYEQWLDPEAHDPEKVTPLLKPFPESEMEMWPVGLAVNSPKHDGQELTNRL
ncbi:MAG TPA: SOS response-associated peptidase [Sulfuricaulis sp.]|nr:SOS response-associated peptidase [Sulfuricaulis sp.]